MPSIVGLVGAASCQIIEQELRMARTGWVRRGIPYGFAETNSAHSSKVGIATALFLEIHPGYAHATDPRLPVLTATFHDFCERGDMPDYTPQDIAAGVITRPEKLRREFANLARYVQMTGNALPWALLKFLKEYPDYPETRLIDQIDKLDPIPMALNLESFGHYHAGEFVESSRPKIHEPLLREAIVWLLAREYPTIDYFYSYCAYLRFAGDVSRTREHLAERRDAVASFQS